MLRSVRIGVAVFGLVVAALSVLALHRRRIRMLGWLLLPGIVLALETGLMVTAQPDPALRTTGFAFATFAA